VIDGVIDIGLVSRALTDDERGSGLVAVAYARAPVVVAVNDSVPDTAITAHDLLTLYGGTKTTWSDGSRVVVLQREQGDSSHRAVEQWLPEFATVNEHAYHEGRFRVLYDDAAMAEALVSTRGAIGLYGMGTIPEGLPIHALLVDGMAPTVADVRYGMYPLTKDLAFVTRGGPGAAAARFFDFVFSDEGQSLIRHEGYVPLARAGAR
jgi:phosphate transport system substrate-binding protein